MAEKGSKECPHFGEYDGTALWCKQCFRSDHALCRVETERRQGERAQTAEERQEETYRKLQGKRAAAKTKRAAAIKAHEERNAASRELFGKAWGALATAERLECPPCCRGGRDGEGRQHRGLYGKHGLYCERCKWGEECNANSGGRGR